MRILILAVFFVSTAAHAQQQRAFHNPCERGPLPKSKLINGVNQSFVFFLKEMRPSMPIETASRIAADLCDDVSIYGNSQALTARLSALMQSYGY